MANLNIHSVNELLEDLHRTQNKFLFIDNQDQALSRDSFSPTLQKVCKDIAVLMNCDRVEIWLFNEDQTRLTVEESYDCVEGRNNSKDTFSTEQVPTYFKSIISERTFSVDDFAALALTDEIDKDMVIEYDDFSAMLDATILLSWGFGGVICCLSEKKRQWTPIEKHVIASIADMLGLILDRFQRTEVEKHIYELAYTDTLTKLNNTHSFEKKVTDKLASFQKAECGMFLYIRLDQFTDIQVALGHDAGEEVLQVIAARLQSSLPDNAIIARVGFDYFTVFLSYVATDTFYSDIIVKIGNEINQPMDISGNEVYITFSHGLSLYPKQVSSVKSGVQAAQAALMDALEKTSRKAVGIYQPVMQDSMKDNLLSEMNLRKGLDANQFQLYYQPQVTCETAEVYGFEALLRWKHPEFGIIYPAKFIQLAESTGLITPIGQWVIKEAFEQLKKWQESAANFSISINLSPNHFLDEDLPDYLLTCARESGVSPKLLILEITEYVAFENLDVVKARIIELNEIGFSISIDDFGTGYSAFSYLQHLPVQQIKIDRQFIKHIVADAKNAALVKTIVQLGKLLNLTTIAEGIETVDEWNMLKEMDCDDLQGFYFGKPLPIDQIDSLIKHHSDNGKLYLPVE